MDVFSRVAAAAVLTCMSAAALASKPAPVPTDRILFARTLLAEFGGQDEPVGSTLYTVDSDGQNQRQLLPLVMGHFYLPGVESDTRIWHPKTNIRWLSRNFSAKGDEILLFTGRVDGLPVNDFAIGSKYAILDTKEEVPPPGEEPPCTGMVPEPCYFMFPGSTDNAAGYGYVTWGPSGTHSIAYTNSAENRTPSPPACLFLITPHANDQRRLWCAPSSYGPSVAVTNPRWSGSGKYILVYVGWNNVNLPGQFGAYAYHDLWRVEVATGTGALVETRIPANRADISFDGNRVIYEVGKVKRPIYGGCAGYTGPAPRVICIKDMKSGRNRLVSTAAANQQGHMLISPHGTETIVYKPGAPKDKGARGYSEIDMYLVRTSNGAVVRRLTAPPASGWPQGSRVVWRSVAWSSDGKRVLANRDVFARGATIPTTDFFVIDLRKGKVRCVGRGNAVDWYQPGW